MAEKNKNIIFRRVRGRIIPIRISGSNPQAKRNRRKITRGAAAVIGGITFTIAVGALSGRFGRAAVETTKKLLFKKKAIAAIKDPRLRRIVSEKAISQQKAARVQFQISQKVLLGGFVTGGIVAGEGITRVAEGIKGRNATIPEEVIASATGIGASTFAIKAFKLGLKGRL